QWRRGRRMEAAGSVVSRSVPPVSGSMAIDSSTAGVAPLAISPLTCDWATLTATFRENPYAVQSGRARAAGAGRDAGLQAHLAAASGGAALQSVPGALYRRLLAALPRRRHPPLAQEPTPLHALI